MQGTGRALGKNSKDMHSWPVSRLPIRSWARRPRLFSTALLYSVYTQAGAAVVGDWLVRMAQLGQACTGRIVGTSGIDDLEPRASFRGCVPAHLHGTNARKAKVG